MFLSEFLVADHWLEGQNLPKRLAVGFSGGADSTALLLALAGCGHEVVAWHVDHRWQAHSAELADQLQKQVTSWGIEFHRAQLPAPSGKNREAEARSGRFALFHRWAVQQGIDTLCLAHHRNDQAETVCMRMLQGSGPAGSSGMRRQRRWQGLELVRPLLHVSREDILTVLRMAGVGWVEDQSNRDTSLLRNRIRHSMFPAMRLAGVEPLELFRRWQVQAMALSERLDGMADSVGLGMQDGSVVARWLNWSDSPQPVRAVVLQRMNARLFGEGAVLGRRHIRLAEAWRLHGGRAGIDLSRCRLFRHKENLHLAPTPVSLPR